MLFGRECIFCRRIIGTNMADWKKGMVCICHICSKKIAEEKSVVITNPQKPLAFVIPCTSYAGDVRDAFIRYKFQGHRAYEKGFLHIALKKLSEYDLSGFDAIMTIPISKERMRERGFNQSLFMASAVSELFNVKEVNDEIIKVRDTVCQSGLLRNERRQNIYGAYSVSDFVKGKNVLIADDLYTSGATMSEAANAMLKKGAKTVAGVVFATVYDYYKEIL